MNQSDANEIHEFLKRLGMRDATKLLLLSAGIQNPSILGIITEGYKINLPSALQKYAEDESHQTKKEMVKYLGMVYDAIKWHFG